MGGKPINFNVENIRKEDESEDITGGKHDQETKKMKLPRESLAGAWAARGLHVAARGMSADESVSVGGSDSRHPVVLCGWIDDTVKVWRRSEKEEKGGGGV
ncbi:hypothetical protein Dimus_039742 [Dionaea muscipula]